MPFVICINQPDLWSGAVGWREDEMVEGADEKTGEDFTKQLHISMELRASNTTQQLLYPLTQLMILLAWGLYLK